MGKKSSVNDRLKRLNEGRCPIHGIWMGQIDSWYYPDDGEPYTIVGCSRDDCEAQAKAYSIGGPWELLSECSYFLDERYTPPKLQRIAGSSTPKAKKSDIWAKTEGLCYYCGSSLEWKKTFCVDHIIPQIEGGGHDIDNVVPSCRNCNSTKGTKTLEEFRFHRRMQKFAEKNGVWFTFAQVEYLRSIGVDLDIPIHIFWFELPKADASSHGVVSSSGAAWFQL